MIKLKGAKFYRISKYLGLSLAVCAVAAVAFKLGIKQSQSEPHQIDMSSDQVIQTAMARSVRLQVCWCWRLLWWLIRSIASLLPLTELSSGLIAALLEYFRKTGIGLIFLRQRRKYRNGEG